MLAVAALAAVSSTGRRADADIMTTQIGSPVAAPGGYNFTYDAVLSFSSQLVGGSNFNQFGTVYDVASTPPPIVATTGQLNTSDFVFSEPLTSTAGYLTTPTDSASLYNIRFTYVGRSTVVGGPFNTGSTQIGTLPVDLGTFTIFSPYLTTVLRNFDGQSIASFGSSTGNVQGNIGTVLVPTPVPEPLTLGGLALGGSMLLARRRRS